MKVRETLSYTVVVKYTGQASMDGEAHWANINMASMMTAGNMIAVTAKVM